MAEQRCCSTNVGSLGRKSETSTARSDVPTAYLIAAAELHCSCTEQRASLAASAPAAGSKKPLADRPPQPPRRRVFSRLPWKFVSRSLLLVVACLISPCCAPLWVPLGLGLLAGTPIAFLLAYSLGWVYGALTLLSALSVVLALRSLGSGSHKHLEPPTRPTLSVVSERNPSQTLPPVNVVHDIHLAQAYRPEQQHTTP